MAQKGRNRNQHSASEPAFGRPCAPTLQDVRRGTASTSFALGDRAAFYSLGEKITKSNSMGKGGDKISFKKAPSSSSTAKESSSASSLSSSKMKGADRRSSLQKKDSMFLRRPSTPVLKKDSEIATDTSTTLHLASFQSALERSAASAAEEARLYRQQHCLRRQMSLSDMDTYRAHLLESDGWIELRNIYYSKIGKEVPEVIAEEERQRAIETEEKRRERVVEIDARDGNITFVCVSDTHSMHFRMRQKLPPGDVLLHAGDFTRTGKLEEVKAFNEWLSNQDYQLKVVIAGNHDLPFHPSFYDRHWRRWHRSKLDPFEVKKALSNCIYLEDEEIIINGISLYGSPWQPWFMEWAFNAERGRAIREKWDMIPQGVDVLMTHGPPAGVLDRARIKGKMMSVGCEDLAAVVKSRKPKYHVFGHIHESYGRCDVEGIVYINACICDDNYRAVHPPISFTIPTTTTTTTTVSTTSSSATTTASPSSTSGTNAT